MKAQYKCIKEWRGIKEGQIVTVYPLDWDKDYTLYQIEYNAQNGASRIANYSTINEYFKEEETK